MNTSPTITKLAEALAKAQAELKTITKDRVNPHFRNRYATLDAIMEGIRPTLAKHGLSVIQGASDTATAFVVETMLLHSSGEYISNTVPMTLTKSDAQGVGSGITYGRRYGVSALLGLATDEDDDGNEAAKPAKQEPKPAPKAEPKSETPKPERVKPSESDKGVTMEEAMTFPYPAKGEWKGKPMGEVPIDVVRSARDKAVAANDPKYADFIARADKVLAFAKGAEQ